MAQVAKEVGLAGEYKYTNAILSKFVHATGLLSLWFPSKPKS